jgi:hypothetical protein
MLEHQATTAETPRQEPFRWSRAKIVSALDDFAAAEHTSGRDFAQAHGIPQATFHYWRRQYLPDDADGTETFFRSAAGELVLRQIVTAALLVFQQRGACGIRLVSEFLHLSQLDRFVACSRGALQPLAAHLEADLVAFRDAEQPALAQAMKRQTITVVADEHFHSGKPCLVGLEPVSGFLLVECYRDRRDADTWKEAIQQGAADLPVEIVQLTSDLARALLCCAEKGLHVAHSPDLFHGQRDLLRPLLLPLQRPIQQAEKELEKAQQLTEQLDVPTAQASAPQVAAISAAVRQELALQDRLEQAQERQQKAVQEVRGVADDYHPFDRHTGRPVTAAEVGQRLNQHLAELEQVATAAHLGEKPRQALAKARPWVTTLLSCIAWFWCLVKARVQELELSDAQERAVYDSLVAGHYWSVAAGRARTGAERQRLKKMAAALQQEAWQEGGALASLGEQEKQRVAEVAQACAGLFQRSSSCVEGRNGRLSLQQHGHSRVSEQRLRALTVIHNYLVQGADGTTAAERFFGQKHKDLFSWLLQRLPDLPRPAQKRPRQAA